MTGSSFFLFFSKRGCECASFKLVAHLSALTIAKEKFAQSGWGFRLQPLDCWGVLNPSNSKARPTLSVGSPIGTPTVLGAPSNGGDPRN